MAKAKKKKGDGRLLFFAISEPKGCAQVQQNGTVYLLNCSGFGPPDLNGNNPNRVFIKWYKGTGTFPSNPPFDATPQGLSGPGYKWSIPLNMNILPSDLGQDFSLVAWYAYGMMSQIRQVEISVFQPQTQPCLRTGKRPSKKPSKKPGK